MTPDKRNGPAEDGAGSVNQQKAGRAESRVTRTPDTVQQARPMCSRCARNPVPKVEPVPGCGTLTGLCLDCLARTCPDCGHTFNTGVGHCRGGRWGGCCRSFNSHRDGDAHQRDGRCRTDADLTAAGWVEADGWWTSAASRLSAERARAQFGSVSADRGTETVEVAR